MDEYRDDRTPEDLFDEDFEVDFNLPGQEPQGDFGVSEGFDSTAIGQRVSEADGLMSVEASQNSDDSFASPVAPRDPLAAPLDSDDPFAVAPAAPGQFSRRGGQGSKGSGGKKEPKNGAYIQHDGSFERTSKPVHRKSNKVILIAVIAVLVAVFGVGGYFLLHSIDRDAGQIEEGLEVTFTIPNGAALSTIANELADAGVISDAGEFVSYVQAQGAENKIKPGDYRMVTGMTDEEVLVQLIAGPNNSPTLVIPEGYTLEQTAQKVADDLGLDAETFIQLAHSADQYVADYPFLADAYNNSLEGYLFPKTYTFEKGVTEDQVIRAMLDQYEIETAGIDYSYAASKNLTQYDVLILASCIEEETFFDEDRTHIAGVLYNRLAQGIPLGLDVTVSYAVGKPGAELTADDLAVESPYNTYVNYGLPAGPICSPGLASIEAAAHPMETADLYFILTESYSSFYPDYESFLAGKEAWQAENA